MSMNGLNMAGMGGGAPTAPLAGLASLGLAPPREKDWDQVSMYSQKTDRGRLYNFERQGNGKIYNTIYLSFVNLN